MNLLIVCVVVSERPWLRGSYCGLGRAVYSSHNYTHACFRSYDFNKGVTWGKYVFLIGVLGGERLKTDELRRRVVCCGGGQAIYTALGLGKSLAGRGYGVFAPDLRGVGPERDVRSLLLLHFSKNYSFTPRFVVNHLDSRHLFLSRSPPSDEHVFATSYFTSVKNLSPHVLLCMPSC